MQTAQQIPNPEPQVLGPKSLFVTQLSLTSFRNYVEARLVLEPSSVVLTGPNGSGKTNALEAVSLFLPGRGLRRAPLAELQNREHAEPWAVFAEMTTPHGSLRLGTGRDPEAPEKDRRVTHIDGKPARSQQDLADRVAMAWVTPDMDRLLAEGPSARRRFLDRLVCSFDPAHAGRVHRYEKALRERLRLLREGRADAVWLDALENAMAQTGTAIAAARLQLLQQLQRAMAQSSGAFPQADVSLHGVAEESLSSSPALLVEDKLRAALKTGRAEDAQSGTCAAGPHRSDLAVTHKEQQCPADLCSTGEQKALVIAIMLAYARILENMRRTPPLLLLDDITAHLDARRRAALFEEVLALGGQAWLTGTDRESFGSFVRSTQHFRVEKGRLVA